MKTKFRTIALAFALFFSFTFHASADASVVVDRVVAVVNGEIITLSDLQREEALRKTEGKQDVRLLLEDMIDRKLQMTQAKRAGLDVTDKELNDAIADIKKRNSFDDHQFEAALAKDGLTLEQYRKELMEQMTLSRVFNKFVRSAVAIDEAEVKAYYEKNIKLFSEPEEIRVRRIFFRYPESATPAEKKEVRERAEAALERAKRGEDFTRLVKELSDGEAAALGGDLGFMQRDQAIPEIAEATRGLKPGDIAGPVEAVGGLNIIRLEEVRTPVRPFAKVKDEITKMLYDQKVENSYRTWLQTLRTDADIENKL
jgi:peptidyl-prolyl cis-trans isomerase SurA